VLKFEDIKFDCALYNGYKPCRYGNQCAGCTFYEPSVNASDCKSGAPACAPEAIITHADGDPARILIIKTGAMGDVLRTTTLLPVLKREYPLSHITWITDVSAMPLLSANRLINRLLPLNEESFAEVVAQTYDVLLNFEKEKAPLELAGKIRAAKRIGFAPTSRGTPTVFNEESRYGLLLGLSDELKFRGNQLSYPRIICDMSGYEYKRDPYILELTPRSHARRAEIESLLPHPDRSRVGLNTGCGAVFRTKQWTLEGWVGLVKYIQAHAPGTQVLLLGGKAETELNREILARTDGVIDTGVDNPLEEFFGVVDTCDVVVSSDSLGMHIAIALKKYVVALIGSTSSVEIDLFDRGEKIVTTFACAPCYQKTCDLNPTCMQAMTPESVGEAVMRGLEKTAATPLTPQPA
jgi:ADP-heptose:LPS heptosyltransferase